jgi:hypothetical protein
MKTPVALVTPALTAAIVLAASLLIVRGSAAKTRFGCPLAIRPEKFTPPPQSDGAQLPDRRVIGPRLAFETWLASCLWCKAKA